MAQLLIMASFMCVCILYECFLLANDTGFILEPVMRQFGPARVIPKSNRCSKDGVQAVDNNSYLLL